MPIQMTRDDLNGSVDWQNRQITLPTMTRNDPREDARRLALGGFGGAALERLFVDVRKPQNQR